MPGTETDESASVRRELLFALPSPSNFERDGDALIVRNVHLLDAGVWTDEAQRSPCEYETGIVQRYATNWADSSLWSRHAGGQPRSVVDRIGVILNQHAGETGAEGDLRLHGLTQQSRDTIALVEAGEVDAFSAELVGPEKWNPGKRQYRKEAITFLGGAIVAKGACKTCALRHNSDGEEPPADPAEACETDEPRAEPPEGAPAETDMDTTELETKIAELEAAHAETQRALAAANDENAALKASAETGAETLRALAERIEKLEKTPAPRATAPAEPARELSLPPRYVTRNGETYLEP